MSESGSDISRPGQGGRSGVAGRVRPRLGVLDLLLELWRARLLMFLIFSVFALAGLVVIQLFPAKAVAIARVQVTTAPEIAMIRDGDSAARITIRPSRVDLEAERRRASSPEYAAAVIFGIGPERLFLNERIIGGADRGATGVSPEARFMTDLEIVSVARSSAIEFRYAHANETTAVEALNAYVNAYLARRSMKAQLRDAPASADDDAPVAVRLQRANEAILAFLDEHQIADFHAEVATLDATLVSISQSLVDVRASLSAARGRTGALEGEIGETPAEVRLFVETLSTDRLDALESERSQMLARFGADHPIITELDLQIAAARQSPTEVMEAGRTRTGPNPVHQSLETARAAARTEIAALERRASALLDQRSRVESERRSLAALEPEWRALTRTRAALERESEGQAKEFGDDEAEPIERPDVELLEAAHIQGDHPSPTRSIAAIFAVVGLIAAVVSGLVRGWMKQGVPSPAVAERTLGLRVLATAGKR